MADACARVLGIRGRKRDGREISIQADQTAKSGRSHILEIGESAAYALMAQMDYNRKQRVRLKAGFLRLFLGSGLEPARENLLVGFIETYVPLDDNEQVESDEQFDALMRKVPEVELLDELKL